MLAPTLIYNKTCKSCKEKFNGFIKQKYCQKCYRKEKLRKQKNEKRV